MTESTVLPAKARARGSDRVSVAMLSLAAFFTAFALLAWQQGQAAHTRGAGSSQLLVRRVYRTTVIERVLAAGAGTGSQSVSQSVSSPSSSEQIAPAPVVTRAS